MFTGKSVLSASQFSTTDLSDLMNLSLAIENKLSSTRQINLLPEYILSTLFFEPSTRTRLSFESAMLRLGGKVISTVGVQFSSLAKGESLYDTLKMVEAYSDICAIRHPAEGASVIAAQNISIPVINAGDGAGEHPTQGLLDLYTIEKHRKISEKKLSVAFVGDIKHGRTIHSLIQLLSHYDCEMIFVSPKELGLPHKYREMLGKSGKSFTETEDIDNVRHCDVVYVTRIQEERFADRREYEKFKDNYIVDRELIETCRKEIIVMHPLPRLSEVSTDLDDHKSAVYFDQARNGLFVRMALILRLLAIPDNDIRAALRAA